MRHRSIALIVATALLAVGCTAEIPGRPRAAKVVKKEASSATIQVRGSDNGPIDRLAATVVTDVKHFWMEKFPTDFDKEWRRPRGAATTRSTPPTPTRAATLRAPRHRRRGQRVLLSVGGRDRVGPGRAAAGAEGEFGEAAVMFVLAHEMGHAVQRRTGLTIAKSRQQPRGVPDDPHRGAGRLLRGFVRRLGGRRKGQPSADLPGPARLRLEALVIFRDPVGTEPDDQDAHGDAFDRVSAFQDGYDQGVECART